MKAIIRELCKLEGMVKGEIKCQPMTNQDEADEVEKLIRAQLGIGEAISEIGSFMDTKEMEERRKAKEDA
jgi:hypothetical protein